MAVIWANRLIAGDKSWGEVPAPRRAAVKAELHRRAAAGEIAPERYAEITGEAYAEAEE